MEVTDERAIASNYYPQKKELLQTNPQIIDYPVLSEEIKDAEYALENIDNNDALNNVRLSTTSGSIYDLLTDYFVDLGLAHE